jgi:hypothetical protein
LNINLQFKVSLSSATSDKNINYKNARPLTASKRFFCSICFDDATSNESFEVHTFLDYTYVQASFHLLTKLYEEAETDNEQI